MQQNYNHTLDSLSQNHIAKEITDSISRHSTLSKIIQEGQTHEATRQIFIDNDQQFRNRLTELEQEIGILTAQLQEFQAPTEIPSTSSLDPTSQLVSTDYCQPYEISGEILYQGNHGKDKEIQIQQDTNDKNEQYYPQYWEPFMHNESFSPGETSSSTQHYRERSQHLSALHTSEVHSTDEILTHLQTDSKSVADSHEISTPANRTLSQENNSSQNKDKQRQIQEAVEQTRTANKLPSDYFISTEHIQALVDKIIECKKNKTKFNSRAFLQSINVMDPHYKSIIITRNNRQTWKSYLNSKSLSTSNLILYNLVYRSLDSLDENATYNRRESKRVSNLSAEQKLKIHIKNKNRYNNQKD